MRHEPAIARFASPSRNTPSVGCKHGVGRSPGLRSGIFPVDPAFPTRVKGQWLVGISPVTVAGAAAFRAPPDGANPVAFPLRLSETGTNGGTICPSLPLVKPPGSATGKTAGASRAQRVQRSRIAFAAASHPHNRARTATHRHGCGTEQRARPRRSVPASRLDRSAASSRDTTSPPKAASADAPALIRRTSNESARKPLGSLRVVRPGVRAVAMSPRHLGTPVTRGRRGRHRRAPDAASSAAEHFGVGRVLTFAKRGSGRPTLMHLPFRLS